MTLKYLSNVVTLSLDPDLCIGCGLCLDVCPHAVFVVENNKARIVDRDSCMECGACSKNCPVNAISVRSGVGCAAGIIAGSLGIKSGCCCGGEYCKP
jgi:ferredoxin